MTPPTNFVVVLVVPIVTFTELSSVGSVNPLGVSVIVYFHLFLVVGASELVELSVT